MWIFYTSEFNIKVRGMKRRTKTLMFTCFQHIPLTKILVIGPPTLKKKGLLISHTYVIWPFKDCYNNMCVIQPIHKNNQFIFIKY